MQLPHFVPKNAVLGSILLEKPAKKDNIP